MALWTCNLSVCSEDIEFQIQFPDDWTDQQVYDYIYADMWLDVEKEK